MAQKNTSTEEKWGNTLKYRYFYNSEGDLAKKLDVTTGKTVNYEYDSLDRLIHSYQTDNGTIQQRTEHLYDSENRLVSQSWQLGDTLYKEAFTYSTADGSLTKVDGTGFTTYSFAYDSLKRLSSRYSWIYRQDYTYRTNGGNQTTQIASIDYAKRDGGTGFTEFKLGYAYDAAGNITKITGTTRSDQSASYTYDAQNQLTSETNQKGSYTYTYDTYGNIRSVSGAESHTYTYGDSEWLDLLTAYDGKSITYDAIGNPNVWHNSTGDWNLSWANGRQLTTASNDNHRVSYTYDLAGVRDSKTVDGVTYNYITQNGQVVRQTWTSGGENHVMDFIYDNTGKPYAVKYDNQIFYYVLNLQGDVIAIITHWGAAYGTYTYDAWGNVISQSGSIANINPIRYRGYYYDSETGLYYLGSRYYDPLVKRFINADDSSVLSIEQGSMLQYNLFSYCLNNPSNRTDVDGNLSLPNIVKVGIGVGAILVGAAVVAATGGAAAAIVGTVVAGLKTAAISGAVAAGTSAAITATASIASGNTAKTTIKKTARAAANGFANGFMWGGISFGASRAAGYLTSKTGIFKRHVTYGKNNFMYGNNELTIWRHGPNFRIDANATHGLHYHWRTATTGIGQHRTKWIAAIIGAVSGLASAARNR